MVNGGRWILCACLRLTKLRVVLSPLGSVRALPHESRGWISALRTASESVLAALTLNLILFPRGLVHKIAVQNEEKLDAKQR